MVAGLSQLFLKLSLILFVEALEASLEDLDKPVQSDRSSANKALQKRTTNLTLTHLNHL